jgi:hypothetical protein
MFKNLLDIILLWVIVTLLNHAAIAWAPAVFKNVRHRLGYVTIEECVNLSWDATH